MSLETSEMSMDLQQDEILLYVDLPESDPLDVIDRLKTLGYDPQPRHYTWYLNGDPTVPIRETCALLHREVSADPETLFSLLQAQWDKLSDLFGDEAVALVWGTNE